MPLDRHVSHDQRLLKSLEKLALLAQEVTMSLRRSLQSAAKSFVRSEAWRLGVDNEGRSR
jgi:hypothetical protein